MMGKTKKAVFHLVTQFLAEGPKTRKDLKHLVKARDGRAKKYVRKALKGLVECGEVRQEGKVYHAVVIEERETEVPIGMRMRAQEARKVEFAEPAKSDDLDDEIRRLETELANQYSSSSDDDRTEDGQPEESCNAAETAVLSLSEYANDRIDCLPSTLLPEPGRYNANNSRKSNTSKKKIKQSDSSKNVLESGLKQAVQEVLDGYTARSAEKLPFYCRFCSKQYSNEKEFFDHRNTDFHRTAVAMERKATYCRLCRRQLTSPTQMKEHLKSRPHLDCLREARSRQLPKSKRQL
jgi:Zinc-finger of C2H2 type